MLNGIIWQAKTGSHFPFAKISFTKSLFSQTAKISPSITHKSRQSTKYNSLTTFLILQDMQAVTVPYSSYNMLDVGLTPRPNQARDQERDLNA